MAIDTLYLPAGTSTVTLRASKVGGDLALYSLELVRPEVERALKEKAEKLRSSTKWLADAKYGLFFHWTSGTKTDEPWKATWPRRGERKVFPKNVDDFKVDPFVEMVRETGAGYIIFSLAWASQCFPAPIKAVDNILPGRTSRRDLIREIADGLGKHGIKLMLYYHPGGADPEWWNATEKNFTENWCAITSEVGRRYGPKLAGWWFDGPGKGPFDRMAVAAKAGNPNRIITYNNGNFWPTFTDFQDYLAAEGPHFWIDQSLLRYLPKGGSGIFTGGRHEGLQAHQSFPLEVKGWIHNMPDEEISAPVWDKDSLVKSVKEAVERRFVASMAIAVYEDGTASPQTIELLRALRKAVRES
jgi:acylphosphatase